jgi:hypothetical protein
MHDSICIQICIQRFDMLYHTALRYACQDARKDTRGWTDSSIFIVSAARALTVISRSTSTSTQKSWWSDDLRGDMHHRCPDDALCCVCPCKWIRPCVMLRMRVQVDTEQYSLCLKNIFNRLYVGYQCPKSMCACVRAIEIRIVPACKCK